MILCLVTDRRRLGTAAGAPPEKWNDLLEVQVAAAASAGVDYVQVREGDLDAAALARLVRVLVAACHDTPTKVLVNDRLDVAMAAGAAGVHLKEISFSPEDARRLAPSGFVVSCAVHTPVTAAARRCADLLIAGTVLPTASKPAADYLEWQGLKAVVDEASGTPVIGIGGLDVSSVARLTTTGAAGLATIGAFIPPEGHRLVEFVKKQVADLRFAFDSTRSPS